MERKFKNIYSSLEPDIQDWLVVLLWVIILIMSFTVGFVACRLLL